MTAAGATGEASGASARTAYRPEIDGLRAIAVIAVILNHTGTRWMSGGYLGVDLFFAISGYLITGILAAELTDGRFSIARFYERRIRRIVPALMLVTLLSVPFAWRLMLPDGLENFGQSMVGTALFANNIVLLLTAGYFEFSAQFKPLLHTWSLGVEEQYYLIVPLLMGLAWRIGRARGLWIGIAAVTLLSFLCCLALARIAPRFDFFLIISRGWEIGAGALVALVEPRLRPMLGARGAAMASVIGLLLALAPLLLVGPRPSPSLLTLVPIGGICLILLFGGTRDPAGRMLSSRPFVALGLISYSVYLFHQPIFAFVRVASFEPPRPWQLAALIPAILLCGWASWRFVERPFRDRRRVSTRAVLSASGAASLAALALGLTFHLTSGFYRNWPELGGEADSYANIAYNEAPTRFAEVNLPADGSKVRVLVIGNSFARDFINIALETGRMGDRIIAFRPYADCRAMTAAIRAEAARADFVVLATRFGERDVPCIAARLNVLRQISSAQVIIIGRKQFGYNMNAPMQFAPDRRLTWRAQPLAEAVAANEAARRALPLNSYVDVFGMLDDGTHRVPIFTPQGKLISQDGDHLTRAGAAYLAPILFRHPALAALLNAQPNRARATP